MYLKKLASIAASVAFMLAPVTAAHADSLPSAPINVAATGAGVIHLTWDAPNYLAEGVTEFDPYISADKGKTWTKADVFDVEQNMLDSATGISQQVSYWGTYQYLKPLATYKVKVVAVSPAGTSADSAIVTVKMAAVAPWFGMGGVLADSTFKFNKGVHVKWQVTSNGGKPITSYAIKYRQHSADNSGAWIDFKQVSAKAKSITIPYSKLKAWTDIDVAVYVTNAIGTTYDYCEVTVDAQGNISVGV